MEMKAKICWVTKEKQKFNSHLYEKRERERVTIVTELLSRVGVT